MAKDIEARLLRKISEVRTLASASSGATDLSYTAATRVLASSTGADATLPLVTTGNAGLAPATGGGTTTFLRADATYAIPPGTMTHGQVMRRASLAF